MEAQKFATSDHVRAMALPTAQTVKGDFNQATLTHLGVTSTFDAQNGVYFVTTEGPDGKLTRYQVAYVFGHFPLQQYLVHFPGGRLQCLPLAYDTRDKKSGGQRWFHLYGNDKVAPDDPLFWTGPMQNWNHMCAGCHSTAVEKGYDEKTDSFKTTWTDVTLSCESCHGPAEDHLAWAQKNPSKSADPHHGFARSVVDRQRMWIMNPATGIAKRQSPPPPAALVDSCAKCHARAEVLDEKAPGPAPFLECRRPSLLEDGLYYGTGEIRDEDYEWGSFTQSRMHHAGVTCADCHDAHSGKTRQTGNMLCAQCHLPAKFDVPSHHHHAVGSAGAQCINCHMPTHTYMGVDVRRDHGFRIPRPDLTVKYGAKIAPNSCAACHIKSEENAAWAAQKIAEWTGGKPKRHAFGEILSAARANAPGVNKSLAQLATDNSQGDVVRATALQALLQQAPQAEWQTAQSKGLADPSPLVRAVAVAALGQAPPQMAATLGAPALSDPSKNVRLAAARVLAGYRAQLPPEAQVALDHALVEDYAAEAINADRAPIQLNLGLLALAQGKLQEADDRFAKAIARDPSFAEAWVNRADLRRQQNDEAGCEKILREGLQKAYDKSPLHHSLGLLCVRQKRLPEAEAQFAQAHQLRPDIPQHALLLALVKDAQGQTEAGLKVLRDACKRHPHDGQLLSALAGLAQKAGHLEEAQAAQKLLAE